MSNASILVDFTKQALTVQACQLGVLAVVHHVIVATR